MAKLNAALKSGFESTLVEQLDSREVGGSSFARGNEIVSKLETLIKKVSEASLASQASVAVPALPPHDKEPAVNVLDKEEDVVLALQDAHSIVTGWRSGARFVQQLTQDQLSNRTVN